MATISFSLPSDKQTEYDKFKRTAFMLNISQGEAISKALEDFNIKHDLTSEAPIRPITKNCIDLLIETEPNELRKQITDLKTEAEFAKVKGQAHTIKEEADKGSIGLFYKLRGLRKIRTAIEKDQIFRDSDEPIDDSKFMMPVLQGNVDE